MWPKRGTGGTQGESTSGIKVPLPPRSALTLIISNRQNDNVRYTCCCSVVVRARSAVNQCANHCNSFGERERANVRERVLEKCGQVRSRHRHRLQLQSSSPVCVPTGGPRTWLQLRHYLSPSPFITLALPLSLTRAQRSGRRSALVCSACVRLCVRACVCERACV